MNWLKKHMENISKINKQFDIFGLVHRYLYSNDPKTGRPVFGFLGSCPVVESSGFQITSEIRTILSGFQTSGSNALYEPDVRFSDVLVRTGTKTGLEPVLVD